MDSNIEASASLVEIHTDEELYVIASLATLALSSGGIELSSYVKDDKVALFCGTDLITTPLTGGYPYGCYTKLRKFFSLPGHSISACILDAVMGEDRDGNRTVVGHQYKVTVSARVSDGSVAKLYSVIITLRDKCGCINGGQIIDLVLAHYRSIANSSTTVQGNTLSAILSYVTQYRELIRHIDNGTSMLTTLDIDLTDPAASVLQSYIRIINSGHSGVEQYNDVCAELKVLTEYDISDDVVTAASTGATFSKSAIESLLSLK